MRETPASKTAVVLGGSWFIGKAVVESLLRRDWKVVTVNRGISPVTYSLPVERVRADRLQPDRYVEVLKGIAADVLIDTTAYRAGDILPVLKAFEKRLTHAVHVSTLSVYRSPFPCPIPEEWPLEEDPENGYGFHKAECERLLAAEPVGRFPWSILRLPAVYGPGDPTSREHFYYKRLAAGEPIFLPYEGEFLCQNVFVEDVAEACCLLLDGSRTAGRIYNIGSRPFTLREYVETAMRVTGKRVSVVTAQPDSFVKSSIRINEIPYFFNGDLVLKTSRIEEETGFKPAVGLEEGMERTFRWMAADCPAVNPSESWRGPSLQEFNPLS